MWAGLLQSQSAVHLILKKAHLKPHKTEYWCGKCSEPEYGSKMLNIVGFYMTPTRERSRAVRV